MSTGKYLKIVGFIELVASAIYIIYDFIVTIGQTNGAIKTGQGWAVFFAWVEFAAVVFFAPAIGVLFITVGELATPEEKATYVKHKDKYFSTESKSIKEPIRYTDYMTREEADEEIEKNRNILNKGVITQEQFDERVRQINSCVRGKTK